MLYCPKCNQTYEEGVQRFCTKDNTRLIPAAGNAGQTKNVFTNILNRIPANSERSKMFSKVPVLGAEENFPAEDLLSPSQPAADFEPLIEKSDFELDVEIPEPDNFSESQEKPVARLIHPSEIPASQAALGDRAVNPIGRQALTWENSEVLIGQTIKGRYTIISKLGEDETGFIYLAEDKISNEKKVIVRVLLAEDSEDLSTRILSEERVSLSHVNHPNVAHLFDSGELHEGFPFVVTEYIAGETLKEKINANVKFQPENVARIIRQAANALDETHRNGILHRNLKPKNIILAAGESGEKVKVTDFGIFDGFEGQSLENLAYLAPEQLQESYPTSASDRYSLAVIAFQILTGKLPFDFSTAKELLKAQKEKLNLLPTDLRYELPLAVNEVFEKALAFNPAERFANARDFSDALSQALTAGSLPKQPQIDKPVETTTQLDAAKELSIPKPATEFSAEDNQFPVEQNFTNNSTLTTNDLQNAESEAENMQFRNNKTTGDLPWEKRSPEPMKPINGWRIGSIALGILLLCGLVWGIWSFFLQRLDKNSYAPAKTEMSVQNTEQKNGSANSEPVLTNADVDVPPPSRTVQQPPETVFFENSKSSLKGDLAKNFRGFSLYYPNDWVKNPSTTNFLDVGRFGATNTPIEQLLIRYYESKGTFAADEENFSKLVEKSNEDLAGIIADYQVVDKGETTVNNGWKAYEVKFQGSGTTVNGDKITLWGKRLWIPPARLDVKTGFLITMLATSNSPEVKSADDVGVKGELAGVMQTFEPAPLDAGY